MADSQIKSRERVSKRGEVFTAKREVNAMLDLVKHETERLDSRFLEPACGTGNFLEEILLRKLDAATRASIPDGKKTPIPAKFERNSIVVLTSIYGVDLMFDNVAECRARLYEIWHKAYKKSCRRSVSELVCGAAKVILSRNIIQGNSLSMKKVDDRQNDLEDPIVFSEWSFIGEYRVKRTDYRLDKMLAGKYKGADAKTRRHDVARPPRPCRKGEGALATAVFATTSLLLSSSAKAQRNLACMSGSPPEKVTPPPEDRRISALTRISCASSATVQRRPHITRAPWGQSPPF